MAIICTLKGDYGCKQKLLPPKKNNKKKNKKKNQKGMTKFSTLLLRPVSFLCHSFLEKM